MNSIIEVKNIGKKYNIAHANGRYISLRDVLANIIKKPFSFLKIKAKRAVGLEKKEEFWALKGMNFEVKKGEVVGIIGKNGAGKSTLLKILSQITPPTEGEIVIRGRVGSLLEVGTGFHPELTGRENIFLNGAILGMKRVEIARKFNEIVAFAGVEKFLDTPVKHYSSGMYVRLAFSVAAHMEPDILIVDEVLAVGDAEFQKKCLGKMGEITKKDGRTILFVSHNMGAIEELCDRVLLLHDGIIVKSGPSAEIVREYLSSAASRNASLVEIVPRYDIDSNFIVRKIKFASPNSIPWVLKHKQDLVMEITLENKVGLPNFQFGIGIDSMNGQRISTMHDQSRAIEPGIWNINVHMKNILNPGFYDISLGILGQLSIPRFAFLQVVDNETEERGYSRSENEGDVSIESTFVMKNLSNL